MNLKSYYELDCPNLKDIQTQALDYLTQIYNLSDQESLKTDAWLKIDYKNFAKANQDLLKWFKTLKLVPREFALTVINDAQGLPLHIDELPVIAKINIPLLNYNNVSNEWWSIPEHIINSTPKTINQWGSSYYIFNNIDLSKCKKIAEVDMTLPIVFNSQQPHRVVCKDGCRFPRVVLTCMFFKEPVDYLN